MIEREPNPDADVDEWLSAVVREAPLPPVPLDVAGRVRRRVQRRQWGMAIGGVCASAAAVAGLLLLRPRPVEVVPSPVDGLNEARALVAAPPPVDRLAVLAQQQDAYLALLEQMQEE